MFFLPGVGLAAAFEVTKRKIKDNDGDDVGLSDCLQG